MTELTRSYAEANRELIASFGRYMESRGWASETIRGRNITVLRLAESLGPVSFVETMRSDIHTLLASFLRRGLTPQTVNKHTNNLRAFFKFLVLSGLISRNPMAQIGRRKLPTRLPRVLTIAEVEAIIAAGRNPFERAVPEVLYATGVRLSEFVNIRLENIIAPERMILIQKGKGKKDRWVLYGKPAAKAIAEYQQWRPSQAGYLFEAPAWHGKAATQRQYAGRSIARLIERLAHRAGVAGVHPHAFRRALAVHMLVGGADIRAIQELMGHSSLLATQHYLNLTNEEVDKVYRRSHPHESVRGTDAEEK
jgi:site-specific recombinase XerD